MFTDHPAADRKESGISIASSRHLLEDVDTANV
jgi:hypothetical protein